MMTCPTCHQTYDGEEAARVRDAAPELLAALFSLADRVQASGWHCSGLPDERAKRGALIDGARAAIAKAGG